MALLSIGWFFWLFVSGASVAEVATAVPGSEPRGSQPAADQDSQTEYERAWAERIEQTRRTLFPDGLPHGQEPVSATVDVVIGFDGVLRDFKFLRASGDTTVDAAILRIAHLAAPFAPFPSALKNQFDVLHVVRSWSVQPDGELRMTGRAKPVMQRDATRPRMMNLSTAAEKQTKYASYLADWKSKVTKVSSKNFPGELKRAGVGGDLILAVAIQRDGTIVDVQLRSSSGNRALDAAALRIVHLAAPFASFPPSIKQECDVLHIARTWRFSADGKLELE